MKMTNFVRYIVKNMDLNTSVSFEPKITLSFSYLTAIIFTLVVNVTNSNALLILDLYLT